MTTRTSHKRRGAKFEIDLVDWLRARGYDAERLPLTGAKDEGDLYGRHPASRRTVCIEAKAPGAGNGIDLGGWMKEIATETANFCAARGINPADVTPLLVIKALGKTLDDAYVVQRLADVIPEVTP